MADTTEQTVFDTVKFAKLVSKTVGRTSLTRSAKDTIAMFPAFFSADIPVEDDTTIAASMQAQFGALLVAVISANSDYDRGKYPNPSDYLKNFYNNRNIPTLILGATEGQQLVEGSDISGLIIEHAYTRPAFEGLIGKDVINECWNGAIEQFSDENLNDIYKPSVATQAVMESVVGNLNNLHAPVMEAMSDLEYRLTNTNEPQDKGVPDGRSSSVTRQRKTPMIDPTTGKVVLDARKNPIINTENETTVSITSRETGKQVIVRNDRMTGMEPTLINIQLTSQKGQAPIIVHNIVIGVKVLARSIPSNLMVSNLSEGVMGSRAMFAFVKWTDGQLKIFRDFILGVDSAKENAVRSRDMQHWISSIKSRKMSDRISSLFGNRMPPITSIVCTSYEVAQVLERTGVDLNNAYSAMKLISKYYMLGFIIYDTTTGKLKCLFDGDTEFSVMALNNLKGKQQKEQDLVTMTQIMRMAGKS